MGFAEKFNAGMSSIAKSVKNGAENCKTEVKIAEQNRKIKNLTAEIGNLVVVKMDNGEEMCPEIKERYEAILEARAVIAQLESDREETSDTVVCPKCGEKTSSDMKYCGKCGADVSGE